MLGQIAYSERGGWEGTYSYRFLGREVTVCLYLGWDEGVPVDDVQREALRRFTLGRDELCAQADDALYAYYLELLPDLRYQFGDSADELMPIVDNREALSQLVTPTGLLVREAFLTDDRVIGLLYDCTWDTSHGLAVKIVNETIVEVGLQDIVL
ncbi:DUF6985 domain-containing protein [Mycobacterium sp. NPDC051198]